MSDSITKQFNVNNRPNVGQVNKVVKPYNNSIQEAIVVRIGFVENFEMAIYVSVLGTSELMKVEASMAPGASPSTCTGQWQPYFIGDRVFIAYLYGDPSRPVITGRCYDLHGVSEYIIQEDLPIPQRGFKNRSNQTVRPSPLVLDPEHLNQAGMATINVSPMVVI